MSFETIPLEKFSDNFLEAVELSSAALGGKIVSVSDEFFAEAFHLIQVEAAPSLKGQFGPKGALFSGWETRRHNPDHDWCIIKLGAAGTVIGFDIDTTHFNGNEGPQASVEAFLSSSDKEPEANDLKWTEILPVVNLGPSSRHLFKIPESPSVNYVKLKMHPDGGIARFRVYGSVTPTFPQSPTETFDLAHVFAGGRVDFVSDQHFGVGGNLILPGRGKDMGDGWETKRSRQKDHKDWAIIKLGVPGYLDVAEIDTAHFMGNFPESFELHALYDTSLPTNDLPSEGWTEILPRTKAGPNRRHYFQLENVEEKVYTHVRVTIYPDGGLKRVRLVGRRAGEVGEGIVPPIGAVAVDSAATNVVRAEVPLPHAAAQSAKPSKMIPIVPLTPEAFVPFGQVIQAYADHNSVPRGTKITPANQGTASKFHKLAILDSSYPVEAGATAGLSVYRCSPLPSGHEWKVTVLERHPFTNQAFIPMGGAASCEAGDALGNPGYGYLVVVAKTGQDDKPDLQSLRAFAASAAQGIVYNAAVWHQPMAVFDKPMDFTCVETQIGDGSRADCEILEVDGADHEVFVVRR